MDPERSVELLLLAVAGVLVVLMLLPLRSPILGAILLAYLLDGPHRWLAPRVGSRPAALGLVVATVVVLVVPFVLLVRIAIIGLSDLVATLRGDDGAITVETLLESVFGTDFDGGASIRSLVEDGQIAELLGVLFESLGGLSAAVVQLSVLLFLVYYFLRKGDDLVAWLGSVVPLSPGVQSELLDRADRLLYAVFVGNVAIAVADGLLVGLGLFVVGFSDVLFWTVMSIFLGLIPLVGTTVVWVPAAAYLVLTGEVVAGVGLFLYGALVVGSIDNLLRPFVGAPEAGLDPALFVIGVFAGLAFFGVLGVFYGPIALAMTKILFETLDTGQPRVARGE